VDRAARYAELGGRLGPAALLAIIGGFVVWMMSVGSWPQLAALGSALGVIGSLLALAAAGASAVGLASATRRRRAVVGLVTAGFALVLPFLLTLLLLWALVSAFQGG
jgi:hypothetical protein